MLQYWVCVWKLRFWNSQNQKIHPLSMWAQLSCWMHDQQGSCQRPHLHFLSEETKRPVRLLLEHAESTAPKDKESEGIVREVRLEKTANERNIQDRRVLAHWEQGEEREDKGEQGGEKEGQVQELRRECERDWDRRPESVEGVEVLRVIKYDT